MDKAETCLFVCSDLFTQYGKHARINGGKVNLWKAIFWKKSLIQSHIRSGWVKRYTFVNQVVAPSVGRLRSGHIPANNAHVWYTGKVTLKKLALVRSHTHSCYKAVWKPKGFTRENCFQQISRERLVWEQSWKNKLGFIFDFSPG